MTVQFDNTNTTTVTLASNVVNASSTLTFPAADGTSGQTLITTAAGVLSWGAIPAASTPGVIGTANTTGLNATINVNALTIDPTGSSSSQSFALVPGGGGNIYSYIPTGGTRNNGQYNLVLQGTTAGTITQLGNNSVIFMGDSNIVNASCNYHTSVSTFYTQFGQNANVGLIYGDTSITNGNSYIGLLEPNNDGYNVGMVVLRNGRSPQMGSSYSTAMLGYNYSQHFTCSHDIVGIGYDSPNFTGNGTLSGFVHLIGQTTNATPFVLYPETANVFSLLLTRQGAYYMYGTVVCASSNSGGTAKSWEFGLLVKGYDSSNQAFVGSPTVSVLFGDTALSAYTIAVSIFSGGYINVTATGGAGDTVNWNCQMNYVYVGAR